MLALALACSDSPTDPIDPPAPLAPSPFLVSNPAESPAAGRGGQFTEAWVSLPPGALPEAQAVFVSNPRAGSSVTVQVVNGGFDPVALAAAEGDTLDFLVQGAGGSSLGSYRKVVAKRSPPAVVRTSPPPNKRDVPLNTRIVVTFSEPMDAASLPGAVTLLAGGAPVPGSVEAEGEDGLRAAFAPAGPLAPLTNYRLRIGTGALDRDGDALAAALESEFTTGDFGPDISAPVVTVLEPESGATIAWHFPSLHLLIDDDRDLVRVTLELWDPEVGGFRMFFGTGGELASYLGSPVQFNFSPQSIPTTQTLRVVAEDGAGNLGVSEEFVVSWVYPELGGELDVRSFTVLEIQTGPDQWYYAPQLTVANGPVGQAIRILGAHFELDLPGTALEPDNGGWPLAAIDLEVPPDSEVELFHELYGDWPVTFGGGEGVRVTGTTARVTLTYRDPAGGYHWKSVVGAVVPGEPPGSYTGGCGNWGNLGLHLLCPTPAAIR
jgi:hypothetical protein